MPDLGITNSGAYLHFDSSKRECACLSRTAFGKKYYSFVVINMNINTVFISMNTVYVIEAQFSLGKHLGLVRTTCGSESAGQLLAHEISGLTWHVSL